MLVLAVAVPFVVIGTVGVWQLSGNDNRRLGAITATDEPVALSWRGPWDAEAKYAAGQVVSYRGASYVAERDNNGESRPDPLCARDCGWGVMAVSGIFAGSSCTTSTGGAGTLAVTVASNNVVTLKCNASQGTDTDADNDGIPDGTDTDDDGDGVPDTTDTDHDNDGVPDGTDTDANGDGLRDDPLDWDADGVPDSTDTDDDGDGVLDTPDTDDDNDGIPDATDPDDAP